ncbi:MAG: hypothetical protein US63_C0036G0004 [Candidatus Moranbacteria bacterium GW2011_GWC2_37_8]|nr:MAG: hypothetical protein US63_C0036G0004 [Candidatus Moranbacteria bacterium GW2011_GWC2_37_8]KKQ60626.1 MAG: hypothetical protein US82_C0031G0007 [Parcubacteria group bacterium GW2011_GWC1_38_22]KKQ80622.1 MAG: hypothetical protein UT03_C0021G0005 [Candidatus Moranbacteria bacterium GW2011_GWD2_38_7]
MYEQYFRDFVAFLFPNKYFSDDSILLFIEGEQSMREFDEYQRIHEVKLDDDAISVVLLLSHMLTEMRKSKEACPKKDLINYYLDQAMIILDTWGSGNLENYKCFEEFLFLRNADTSVESKKEEK